MNSQVKRASLAPESEEPTLRKGSYSAGLSEQPQPRNRMFQKYFFLISWLLSYGRPALLSYYTQWHGLSLFSATVSVPKEKLIWMFLDPQTKSWAGNFFGQAGSDDHHGLYQLWWGFGVEEPQGIIREAVKVAMGERKFLERQTVPRILGRKWQPDESLNQMLTLVCASPMKVNHIGQ
jgi:hypothetical protein